MKEGFSMKKYPLIGANSGELLGTARLFTFIIDVSEVKAFMSQARSQVLARR